MVINIIMAVCLYPVLFIISYVMKSPAKYENSLLFGVTMKKQWMQEQEVKELVSKWGTPHGGLIGVEYGYLKAISTTEESMLYAMECFKKYGVLQG